MGVQLLPYKENRLVKVVLNDGSGIVADLIYDPSGRLAQYKVDGTTTNFVYDGDVIISEYRTDSTHTNYVHGNTNGTPLASYESNGDTLYMHTNHQGSVIALTDSSGGLEQINTYDAYGVAGDLNLGRFGYTGQVWLAEVGLYHYRARAYRAEIGRFLQTDPIGYEDQVNLYAYVHNDPLNNFDPTGMDTENPFEEEVVVTCDCDTGSVFGGMIGNFVSAVGNILHAESTGDDSGEGTDSIPEPKGDGGVDGTEDNNIPSEKPKHRNQDTPSRGEPNSTVEGERRTREYDDKGRPKRDYDKPHQGESGDHVHDWDWSKNPPREHPGRPYSPWPRK